MNASGQLICLNMIVKNEASVIRRCIDSVRPIVDHWVIVDTGSTDDTQDIIRAHLHDLPGELHERPWRDFAHNRSEALQLARGRSDYTLIIDADDMLEIAPNTVLPALSADSYMLEIANAGIVYQRMQLVRSALAWRYEGVLHEFLACDGVGPSGQLSGIRMRCSHDGARRKDPQTYRRDAAVLETTSIRTTTPQLTSTGITRMRPAHLDIHRWIRGVEMPASTYLVRADVLSDLTYEGGTQRHEYVIFSKSARKQGTPQYLDNRQVYGFLAFGGGDGRYIANVARARFV
jgi:glycosyltransferase involved in cell wall biosynthesis